jgi:hypothetical protein
MSKCDLQIEFDQDQETFRGGDTITGKVAVLVNKACTCRDLEVRLVWKTYGRGNRTGETIASQSLFSGEWESGQRHEHAFQFTFPDGPLSYHGDYLNVVWAVETQADIPWAFDPQAEREVNLEAGPKGYIHDTQPPEIPPIAQALGCFVALVFSVGFLISTLVFAAVAVQDAIKSEDSSVFLFVGVFLAAELLVGTLLLYLGLRSKMLRRPFARRVLGEVQFARDHSVYFSGDSVPVRVAFTPRRLSGIRHVSATLICKEQVVSGSGTNRRTHTKELSREQVILTAPPDFRVGYEVEYTGELSLPDQAPPSFYTSDNALLWTIDVHIDIARWLDWEAHQPLIVGVRPATS